MNYRVIWPKKCALQLDTQQFSLIFKSLEIRCQHRSAVKGFVPQSLFLFKFYIIKLLWSCKPFFSTLCCVQLK